MIGFLRSQILTDMHLFKKRDSKSNQNEVKSDKSNKSNNQTTITVERLSDYSQKAPKLVGRKSKMSSSSFTDIPIPPAPDPKTKPAAYLRSIHAVRERSTIVLSKAKSNSLNHFDVDLSKFQDTADYVVAIIKVESV